MIIYKRIAALLICAAVFFNINSASADAILHYTIDDPACFGKNSGTAENADAEEFLLSIHSSVPGVVGKALSCTGLADS